MTHHFAVWAPDYTDPDCLKRRLAVRPNHATNIKTLIENGILSQLFFLSIISVLLANRTIDGTTAEVAGFTVTPESLELDNAERKMNGSMLVVLAANMAEVKTIVESDPYWDGNVVRSSPALFLVPLRFILPFHFRHIYFFFH